MNEPASKLRSDGPWAVAARRFLRRRGAVAGAVLLLGVIAMALASPLFHGSFLERVLPGPLTHDPLALDGPPFESPSAIHWFGTDVHGRDLLARVLYGTRISLAVGLVGAMVSLVIGVVWGAAAGYTGGRADNALMRIIDILYAMPSVIVVVVLISLAEGFMAAREDWEVSKSAMRLVFLFIGLGAVSWLTMARIVRGQVLTLRVRPFVEASRVLGAGPVHILVRHILPNLAGVVIAYLTLTIPSIVLYESFLSFLGLGIQPPHASLGSLMAEGAAQINPVRVYWWILVFPGGTLVVTLLALTTVGDGLRDALEPRQS